MAIDLGHHQAFAALTPDELTQRHEATSLVPLGAKGDGLVVRWCEDGKPAERLHDRLQRLVEAGNVRGAAETAAAIADCLASLIPNGDGSDQIPNGDGDRRLRVAVPLTASPGHRAHLRTAFGNAGFDVDDHDLIGRPYAALAYWLSEGGHRRSSLPRGKTLVLDNDGGRVSALVVDIAQSLVLAEGQITSGRTIEAFEATLVLRRLLEASYGSVGHETPVPWSVLSASIAEIVVSGSGAVHPIFTTFLSERFPASNLQTAPADCDEIVVRGMQRVDVLTSYRCGWPTLDVRFDQHVVRPAGGWTSSDAASTVAPVGTHLSFGDSPVLLRGSSTTNVGDDVVLADAALRIPERVGPFPLMSLHPSGSIEIRGTEASLRLHLNWPVAGSIGRALTVVVENILDLTIDRSPFTPRGDPPRPATGES